MKVRQPRASSPVRASLPHSSHRSNMTPSHNGRGAEIVSPALQREARRGGRLVVGGKCVRIAPAPEGAARRACTTSTVSDGHLAWTGAKPCFKIWNGYRRTLRLGTVAPMRTRANRPLVRCQVRVARGRGPERPTAAVRWTINRTPGDRPDRRLGPKLLAGDERLKLLPVTKRISASFSRGQHLHRDKLGGC